MSTEMDDSFSSALLSKTELHWLLGDINVSKSFEYKIKSSIKKKIQTLTEIEILLLVKSNFFVNNDYNGIEDDGISLGRDMEPGPSLYHRSKNSVLVKQRSRLLHVSFTDFPIYGFTPAAFTLTRIFPEDGLGIDALSLTSITSLPPYLLIW
ncbi:MAG TPA: hypothetical protein VE619_10780, partial [Nitrososphaeraceae archaeon]|nr:hypothetical protein [Nitrososphaeraceae archaeon]